MLREDPPVPTLFAVARKGPGCSGSKNYFLTLKPKCPRKGRPWGVPDTNRVEQKQKDHKGQGSASEAPPPAHGRPRASPFLPAPHSLGSRACRAASLRSPRTAHLSAAPRTLQTDRQRRVRTSAALLLIHGPRAGRAVGGRWPKRPRAQLILQRQRWRARPWRGWSRALPVELRRTDPNRERTTERLPNAEGRPGAKRNQGGLSGGRDTRQYSLPGSQTLQMHTLPCGRGLRRPCKLQDI